MDENHQDAAGSKLRATEDELWLPPLLPKDQKKLDQFRKNGKRSHLKWTGFAHKTLWDWLQLLAALAVPLALGVATYSFNAKQADLSASTQAADQQRQVDQQRETTLKNCLDDIKDLLLNKGLEHRNIQRMK